MDGWIREAEAATYLGLSRGGLKRLRIKGAGPEHGKAGSLVVYKREALDAWARESAQKTVHP